MPRYAIVAVVDATQPETAWESVSELLLNDDAQGSVAYIGAPWLVPVDSPDGPAEYGTDAIQLRVNGERVTLDPAD